MFLSQRIRDSIRYLWKRFAVDGVPESMVIEQITYLLVLKLLEEREWGVREGKCVVPSGMRWSYLKTLPEEVRLRYLADTVFPWLATLRLEGGADHLCHAACAFSKGHVLCDVMACLDALFPATQSGEVSACVYDSILSLAEDAAASFAKHSGAFFTPHHIAYLLANLVRPQAGESICDLSCGNARLLVGAYTFLLQSLVYRQGMAFGADGRPLAPCEPLLSPEQRAQLRQTRFVGCDINRPSALQAWMHLRLLGLDASSVIASDAVGQGFNRRLKINGGDIGDFHIVLGNPPFGSHIDAQSIGESLRWLNTTKAEVLFVELAQQVLRPGGRAALIVPDGLLFNEGRAFTALRRKLIEKNTLHAVISLPPKVFLPFTGVKTSIIVFSAGGTTTRPIWFYSAEADGYRLDARRRETPEANDIPDLMVKYCIRTFNPPGEWLRETQALQRCRHLSFMHGDCQLQWENIPPEIHSYYYAYPWCEQEQSFDSEGVVQSVTAYRGSCARPINDPKDWEVAPHDLARNYNLAPDRYRPESVPGGGYSVHAPQHAGSRSSATSLETAVA